MTARERMPQRPWVTTRTHEAFALAHRLAASLGHDTVTPAHVTLGIVRHYANMAAQILLHSLRLDREVLERELEALLPAPGVTPRPDAPLAWTSADEDMLRQAAVESRDLGLEHLASEHVLLGFLRDPSNPVCRMFEKLGVRFETLRRDVRRIEDNTMVWPDTGPSAP